MKTSWKAAIIILILQALLAGCSLAYSKETARCESSFSKPGTHINACGFLVGEKDTTASLHLTGKLETGSITWTLTEPSGHTLWAKTTDAGEAFDVAESFVSPEPGRYLLTIEVNEAQGDYLADWQAQ